jgi:hypothetical protein
VHIQYFGVVVPGTGSQPFKYSFSEQAPIHCATEKQHPGHKGSILTMARVNGFACLKIVKSKCHIKNRYIGGFMYMSFF